ncbi:MAG: hypothetical protein MUW56_16730 [Chryseobacterium sp.]|nr:hypothetical protein [Chryseobacterium sp.]MCJ7935217.1 hypothetical protein [Chryseobacterium sp.]
MKNLKKLSRESAKQIKGAGGPIKSCSETSPCTFGSCCKGVCMEYICMEE